MLCKLLKNEIKSTSRIIPFVFLAMLAAICGELLTSTVKSPVAGIIIIFASMLVMMGGIISVYGVLAVRYYKSMYGREAYITHTLPVKASKIVLAKVLVMGGWGLLTVIMAMLVMLGYFKAIGNIAGVDLFSLYDEMFHDLFPSQMENINFPSIIAGITIYCALGVLMHVSTIAFSITVGNCSGFHSWGIGASILIYIASGFVLTLLETMSLLLDFSIFGGGTVDIISFLPGIILEVVYLVLINFLTCRTANKHTSIK